jgi:hypothetical protein
MARRFGEGVRVRLAPEDEARIARLSGGLGAVSRIAREAMRRGLDVLEAEARERWSKGNDNAATAGVSRPKGIAA